jgi:hypothetical protein
MLADIGTLKGKEKVDAERAFHALGPEAIFALIRGLNRAAKIEHSCPATVIGKKLHRMLSASQDTELLEFARDEIGAGVGRSRHKALIEDVRVACLLRKNALLRAGIRPLRPVRAMSTAELAAGVTTEKGPRLQQMLATLEQRSGPEVLKGLAFVAAKGGKEVQETARELLDKHLYRQPPETIRKKVKDADPEVRRAAVRLIVTRFPGFAGDLIDLVEDDHAEVRKAAHQALVQLNKGEDLGPAADADAADRERAAKKWRGWWEARKQQ